MPLSPDTLRFVRQHRTDDVRSLALQARRYPLVDMPAAIAQISGWQVARNKIPSWAVNEEIRYPAHLSLEQCSSEVTARYKAAVVAAHAPAPSGSFADLTGGFGVDCAFLAPLFARATYVERQEALCQIAAHNFPALGLNHLSVCQAESVAHLQEMEPVEWIFIDPARRDGHGGKTVAIGDCEPDVSALEALLLCKAKHVLVKLSPMLDLTLALSDLKHVCQAHIVSVGNECKELLLLLEPGRPLPADDIPIHCINFAGEPDPQSFTFTRHQERECQPVYASQLRSYLYEPNASLLKGGAFRLLTHREGLEKLHPNSHLYTSDRFLPHFPGRRFRIISSCGFGKREVKELLGEERKANLTVRNFPATVAELRKRLKLSEGGETYLFATTLADDKRVLISCRAMPAD